MIFNYWLWMGYFYHIAETKHHLKETDEELKGRPDIECFSFSMLYILIGR